MRMKGTKSQGSDGPLACRFEKYIVKVIECWGMADAIVNYQVIFGNIDLGSFAFSYHVLGASFF